MARFTNYATLSYNGRTTDSNTVVGEITEVLTVTKTAVVGEYTESDKITYVLTVVNSGTASFTGLTVTDSLGGYLFGETTVYPLEYTADSVKVYVNGVLQPSPDVTAGPPLVISGISVPAGGNTVIVYETGLTEYAPLGAEESITNRAVLAGNGVGASAAAEETVYAASRADLRIGKSLSPATVTENSILTYTFVIENTGNVAVAETGGAVVTDTFSPILSSLTVTFNGTVWTEGVQYTYNSQTGEFATVAGQITVPAAEYTRNDDGTWSINPASFTLTVSGTV